MKTTKDTKSLVGRTLNYKILGNIGGNVWQIGKEFEGKVIRQTKDNLFLDCGEVLVNSEELVADLTILGKFWKEFDFGDQRCEITLK